MNGEQQTFALAAMSRGMWWATTLLVILLAAVVAGVCIGSFGFGDALRGRDIPPMLALGFAAFIVAVCVFVWAYYRPSAFDVSEAGLTVRWPVRRRLWRAEEIASVRQVTRGEIGTPWRLWGAGGMWGLFGLCKSKSIRRFDAFISRGDGWVLIELTGGRPLVITPADPDRFVQALTGACPACAGG